MASPNTISATAAAATAAISIRRHRRIVTGARWPDRWF